MSAADLVAARDAIAAWARLTYGWMGRSPDYKASFLATLGANAEYYAPYQENARRWYRAAQERVLYLNHALVQPPVDRHRPPDEVADVYVHVEKETDAGLVVSGAKSSPRARRSPTPTSSPIPPPCPSRPRSSRSSSSPPWTRPA